MNRVADAFEDSRSKRDVPTTRPCLVCGSRFESGGFGERVCPGCKSKKVWKDGEAISSRRSGSRR